MRFVFPPPPPSFFFLSSSLSFGFISSMIFCIILFILVSPDTSNFNGISSCVTSCICTNKFVTFSCFSFSSSASPPCFSLRFNNNILSYKCGMPKDFSNSKPDVDFKDPLMDTFLSVILLCNIFIFNNVRSHDLISFSVSGVNLYLRDDISIVIVKRFFARSLFPKLAILSYLLSVSK